MSVVSGPSGSDRSSKGSSTPKSEAKGSLNLGGISAPVVNKTKSAKSPINESAKTAPSPPSRPPSKGTKTAKSGPTSTSNPSAKASSGDSEKGTDTIRQKGGRGAKMAAAAQAYAPHTSTTSSSSHTAEQSGIEAAANTKDFIEHSLAEDLAGSGMLMQKRDTRETDRKRRTSDSKTGKSEEEGEEENSGTETGKIESVDSAEERESGSRGEGKHQELFDHLEQLKREGKIDGLPDIIDAAWGKQGIYEDITEAYDGLRAAQKHFGEKDEDLLKDLSSSTRAAGDILYKENGPDIRTGYLFGPGTDETISYRESVVRFEKISDSFKAIIEKVDGNPRLFTKEIDKLIKLIQIDLKAQESTLDPAHLKQIMQGLFKVQICLQVKTDCDLLLRDMHNLYQTPPTTQN